MSSAILSNILIDTSAYLDLEAVLPSDDDLTLRSSYADRALREGAASGQLKEFSRVFETSMTAPTISLPTDFREPEEIVYALDSSGGWAEFPIIQSRDKFKHSTSEQFSYITGNRQDGFILTLNNMASYTTISLPYQKYPNGFTTLTSICELSDELFVVRKIEAYVLESRSDDRFSIVDADANRRLANMAGRNSKKPPGIGNRTGSNFRNPLS